MHLYTSLLLCTGFYNRFSEIRWHDVSRLLFLCKGNICRSAYCEAKARSLGLPAISRGLEVGDAQASTPKTIAEMAASRGLDVSHHRPRQFRESEILAADLVVAMEPVQAQKVEGETKRAGAQVTLLGLWHSKPRPYLQDPFGLSREYTEHCMQFMDVAVDRLKQLLDGNAHSY
jgi:protein-tyrosine phosphatase